MLIQEQIFIKGINMKVLFESDRIKFVQINMDLLDDFLFMVNDLGNVGRLIGKTEIVSRDKEIKWINYPAQTGI